jgi:hypothetical protein
MRQHSARTIELRKTQMGRLQWFLNHRNFENCGTKELRASSHILRQDCYRSILITRLWPLDTICNRAKNINRTGAAGHPGENRRAATTSQRQAQRTAVHI